MLIKSNCSIDFALSELLSMIEVFLRSLMQHLAVSHSAWPTRDLEVLPASLNHGVRQRAVKTTLLPPSLTQQEGICFFSSIAKTCFTIRGQERERCRKCQLSAALWWFVGFSQPNFGPLVGNPSLLHFKDCNFWRGGMCRVKAAAAIDKVIKIHMGERREAKLNYPRCPSSPAIQYFSSSGWLLLPQAEPAHIQMLVCSFKPPYLYSGVKGRYPSYSPPPTPYNN